MGIIGKIKRQAFSRLPDTNFLNLIYSQLGYFRRFGRLANVRHPRCFNEHLMRLKCSDEMRRPLRTFVSDKELVKLYVRGCLGEGYTPKTLAVLRQPEEIECYAFPPRFAAKPAHGFNDVIIKKGEAVTPTDRAAMKRWIGENYFNRGREPQYRFIEPKVIVEEFIGEGDDVPVDIKVYCYYGVTRFIEVDFCRFHSLRREIFDADGQPLDIEFLFPRGGHPLPCPDLLPELRRVAETLAADFSFVGVDLYVVGNRILVGELTSTPENCQATFRPVEGGLFLGGFFERPTGPPG
ncbi:MAG: hypothetical protein KAX64_05870 [Chromatiaceae bacterium]|nr:hypothetical protein [Chromatiaceae bacterium]